VLAARALRAFRLDRLLQIIMLKRAASSYRPGKRSADWVKVKIVRTIDVLIGGWLPGSGYRGRLAGSVIVGVPGPAGLRYLGEVGSAFSVAELRDLTASLRGLEQSESPFAEPLPAEVARHARWTRAVLAAEVAYAEMTATGRLRHPVWRGLRAG
jgi:bifunctional non-homologous end joining protein LigD